MTSLAEATRTLPNLRKGLSPSTLYKIRTGYPPDLEKIATENILKQAELLADEFAAV